MTVATSTLEEIVRLAVEHDMALLPLEPRGKAPYGLFAPHGKKDATTDPEQLGRWYHARPDLNWGMSCVRSGRVVLDVDPRHGGDEHLHELKQRLGPLPQTQDAITGGDGWHGHFRDPGGELRSEIVPGVEIKYRGYVVNPPSIHPSGQRYEWDNHPDETALADLPDAWVNAIRRPAQPRPAPSIYTGDDPLLEIPAAVYFPVLTGRKTTATGHVRCPFHKGGQETTPSLKLYGTGWACFGCPPRPGAGRDHLGGGIYQLTALLADVPLPLRGTDFLLVRRHLADRFVGGQA